MMMVIMITVIRGGEDGEHEDQDNGRNESI
jgi:hypothetical protein